jgi:hypothetical protein
MTAKAGWMAPLMVAPKQPKIMKYHSGAFSLMMRANEASGNFWNEIKIHDAVAFEFLWICHLFFF